MLEECRASHPCIAERQALADQHALSIPQPLTVYELKEGGLTLYAGNDERIVLQRNQLPSDLAFIQAHSNQERENHRAEFAKYSAINPLEITYLDKSVLLQRRSDEQDKRRPIDFDLDLYSSNVTINNVGECPDSIQWHPSDLDYSIQFRSYLDSYLLIARQLPDNQFCIIMLNPLLGPLTQKESQAFIATHEPPLRRESNQLQRKKYELRSSSNGSACLSVDNMIWWSKENQFLQTNKWVIRNTSILYNHDNTQDNNQKKNQDYFQSARPALQVFAQDQRAYIQEHQSIWKKIWSRIKASDIRVSRRIEGLYEANDPDNPFLVHLVRSSEIPARLNLDALSWYAGHLMLSTDYHDRPPLDVVDNARFRFQHLKWIAEYSLEATKETPLKSIDTELTPSIKAITKNLFTTCNG